MEGYITSGLCFGLLLSLPLQATQTCTTGRRSLQCTKRHTSRHYYMFSLCFVFFLLHVSGHHRQATLEVFGTEGGAHTAGLPLRLRPSLSGCCQKAENKSRFGHPEAGSAGCIHPRGLTDLIQPAAILDTVHARASFAVQPSSARAPVSDTVRQRCARLAAARCVWEGTCLRSCNHPVFSVTASIRARSAAWPLGRDGMSGSRPADVARSQFHGLDTPSVR